MEEEFHQRSSFGDRLADRVTAIIGGWPFIIAQSVVLACWVALNVTAWARHWDPYPFILLNLALSFQAAYASPIIMMSQNRQARLSDRRSHLDLQINLLAEQETTRMLRLLGKLCEKAGINLDEIDQALKEETEPEKVVDQLVEIPGAGRK